MIFGNRLLLAFCVGLLSCNPPETYQNENSDSISAATVENTNSIRLQTISPLAIDSLISNNETSVEDYNNLWIEIAPYKNFHIEKLVIHKWKNLLILMEAQVKNSAESTSGIAKHSWYFSDEDVVYSRIVDQRNSGDVHTYEISHSSDIDFRDPPMTHSINGKQVYHHMDTLESCYLMNLNCLKKAEEYLIKLSNINSSSGK